LLPFRAVAVLAALSTSVIPLHRSDPTHCAKRRHGGAQNIGYVCRQFLTIFVNAMTAPAKTPFA
jgi:hypothetical protein